MAQTRRRTKGEGSAAYKTADGRWRADVELPRDPVTGKRRRKAVYGKTRALCEAERRALVRKVEDGDLGTATGRTAPTVAAWLDTWLETIQRQRVAQRTYQGYRANLDKHLHADSPIGRVRLDRLTAHVVEGYYATLRDAGRRPGTILQIHAVLAGGLKAAHRRGMIARNPMEQVQRPSQRREDAFVGASLTREEVQALIRAADALPLAQGLRWILALSYGPRQSETLALGWEDVDFDAGTIRVRRSIHSRPWRHGCDDPETCSAKNGWGSLCPARHSGGRFFGPTKSAAGSRVYPMPPQVSERMARLYAEHRRLNAQEGAMRRPYTDPAGATVDLVFCHLDGSPLDPAADSKAWRRFLSDAGVTQVRLHDARHTSATMLLELGVTPRVVMDLMGWSQVSMLSRYQHVMDETARASADAVGAALWGGTTG